MNLDDLEEPQQQKPVQKPEQIQQSVSTTGKKESIAYDQSKANLDQLILPELQDKPYIHRAIEYIRSYGFDLVHNLKQALLERKDGKKVLTIREADYCYRKEADLNNDFFIKSLLTFGGFLAEEGPLLSEGIFELRARYNKGIEWKRIHFNQCSPEKQKAGLKLLSEISVNLGVHLHLPLHREEIDSGFHREFLKPEYMTWEHFHAVCKSRQNKTIEEKERIAEQGNLAHFGG